MTTTCSVSDTGIVAILFAMIALAGCESGDSVSSSLDALIQRCNAGETEVCVEVVRAVSEGGSRAMDAFRANRYINTTLEGAEKDCATTASGRNGCFMLGRLYLEGLGVPRDEQKGLAYVWMGCAAGNSVACQYLEKGGYFLSDADVPPRRTNLTTLETPDGPDEMPL